MSRQRMNRKFNRIYRTAKKPENRIYLDFERARIVIFSDHHKGDASPADDFRKNAALYAKALAFYRKNGFALIVLGDNEELWEDQYETILLYYRDIIRQEIDMALESPDRKKIRVWGNHDKEVTSQRFKKRARTWENNILANVDHREGLCLGEDIFLIHGHQGRLFEDQAWKLSRFAAHFVWKTIQKILRIGLDGPAENFRIRDDLEMNYYRWAKKNRVLLICGHTHRAIFGSKTHFDSLKVDIRRLEETSKQLTDEEKKAVEHEIFTKREEVEKILHRRSGNAPKSFDKEKEGPVPCYFNDGCCGYTNGVTCIEIDRNLIRLIKWQRQDGRRLVLEEEDIRLLVKHTKEGRPVERDFLPRLHLNHRP